MTSNAFEMLFILLHNSVTLIYSIVRFLWEKLLLFIIDILLLN